MNMKNQINALTATRGNIIKVLDALSIDQLNKVPDGFNNNIIWNAAHCVVTQQLLVYKLSNLEPRVSNELIDVYRKGAKPLGNVNEKFVTELKELLVDSIKWMEEDYKNGIFKDYNEYTTSYNITLKSTDEAISFNTVHEGLHLGYMMAMMRLILNN